jgi:hypothetical protein
MARPWWQRTTPLLRYLSYTIGYVWVIFWWSIICGCFAPMFRFMDQQDIDYQTFTFGLSIDRTQKSSMLLGGLLFGYILLGADP